MDLKPPPARPVRAFFATMVAVSSLTTLSCERSSAYEPKLAANPVLSAGIGWVVVTSAYARLKAEPASDSKDLAFMRRGEVHEALGREIGDPSDPRDKGIWYRIEAGGSAGWARAGDLDVHPSRERADKAASSLR